MCFPIWYCWNAATVTLITAQENTAHQCVGGHFNLKDLGTAFENRARNCLWHTGRDLGTFSPEVSSTVKYVLYNLCIHFSCIISSEKALCLQLSWNYQALLLASGQITRSPDDLCVQFAVLALETTGKQCLIPYLYCGYHSRLSCLTLVLISRLM